MGDMDTKTMIHIGTEILLIGGLGFWMKKRADTLDAQVEELTKKLAAYEDIIAQQQQLLARHDAMLRQIFGIPNTGTKESPVPARSPVKEPVPIDPVGGSPGPVPKEGKKLEKVSPSKNPGPVPAAKEEERDLSPEELDKILEAELNTSAPLQDIEIDILDLKVEKDEEKPLKQKRKVLSSRKKKTLTANVEQNAL